MNVNAAKKTALMVGACVCSSLVVILLLHFLPILTLYLGLTLLVALFIKMIYDFNVQQEKWQEIDNRNR